MRKLFGPIEKLVPHYRCQKIFFLSVVDGMEIVNAAKNCVGVYTKIWVAETYVASRSKIFLRRFGLGWLEKDIHSGSAASISIPSTSIKKTNLTWFTIAQELVNPRLLSFKAYLRLTMKFLSVTNELLQFRKWCQVVYIIGKWTRLFSVWYTCMAG